MTRGQQAIFFKLLKTLSHKSLYYVIKKTVMEKAL